MAALNTTHEGHWYSRSNLLHICCMSIFLCLMRLLDFILLTAASTKQSMQDVLIEFSGCSSTIMSGVSFSQGAQASFYMLSSLVIIDADCPLRFRTYCKWKQAQKPGIKNITRVFQSILITVRQAFKALLFCVLPFELYNSCKRKPFID